MKTHYEDPWQYRVLDDVEIKPLVKTSKNKDKRKRKAMKKSKKANRAQK